ncbi:MAG: hypothetical protein LUI14_07105 [Lachnospiraceae bacterium]|nr:hypothetical protein [Lachnospiraceae bacterium]MCD7766935.1 hypothetical protein [Lachnospiraceae bacterium]
MTAKRRAAAAGLLAAVTLLGGCSEVEQLLGGQTAWTPQESDAISIAADGSVTEIIRDTLDESYYDVSELESMINSEITEYNSEHGEDTILIETFENEGTDVTLKLWYSSAEDYAEFNNVEFFSGSIIGAQMAGYLFDTSFYQVENGVADETAVSSSRVFQNMSAQVVIVQAPMEVHVEEGTVIYISTNAEMLSSDTVDANGEQENEGEVLVLPSSKLYEGEEVSYEEEKLANRVYILYDTE